MAPQGGTSTISYLQQLRSGLVFGETFENDNFASANGWTTVQGTPANSSNEYVKGIKSFICDGTGSTLSIIRKSISFSLRTGDNPYAEVWFYDDGTTTAGTGPYFKIKLSNGNYYQIGVRNSVSTTDYSCNDYASAAEDNFADSFVPRSVGWHKFEILLSYIGLSVAQFMIDGTAVNNGVTNPVGVTITDIFICSGKTTDVAGTFGYFDEANVYYSSLFQIVSEATHQYDSYDSDGVLVFNNQGTNSAYTWAGDAGLETSPILFPVTSRFQMSKETDFSTIEFVSQYYGINPGDIYQYVHIDFERKFTTVSLTPANLGDQSSTKQGVNETINYGLKNRNTFEVQQLEGVDWKREADNFFYYARTGGMFGVNIDSKNEDAFGVISFYQRAGNTQISLMDSLSANATTNFDVGDYLVLQNKDNTEKQVVTVASVDTNSKLTFNEEINFDVNRGDFVYSQFWFPFQELNGIENNGGFRQVNAQNIRYDWNLPATDFNGAL